MKKSMILALFLLYFFVNSASANLIKNGDFESGFDSWKQGDSLSIVTANNNSYALFNAKNETSYLSQKFYLSPSLSAVTVAFDFFFNSGINGSAPTADFFKSIVRIDTAANSGFDSVTRIIAERDATSGWEHVSMDISLQGLDITDIDPNAKLIFSLKDDRGDWAKAKLDNVSMTAAPVPEPGTILLLGSGLLSLVWYGRKRKKV